MQDSTPLAESSYALPTGVRSISFSVFGEPRPQGSGKLIRVGAKAIKKQDPNFARWRNAVVEKALDAVVEHQWEPSYWACLLDIEFVFPTPKSRPKWQVRDFGLSKYNGTDVDKLVRAIGDGLTISRIVDDDRQFSDLRARKRYRRDDTEPTGAHITVIELAERTS